MEFGRVPEKELELLDFTLPEEPPANKDVLQGITNRPQVYIGCAKWGRKEWVGKIYPKGTREAQFLNEYVKHYNAVELNATHYKIYKPADIQKWALKAAVRDFKFCPKVTKSISHDSGFINAEGLTNDFLDGVSAFGKNLGPIFLQVSEKYNTAQRQQLFAYLQNLPKGFQFFLEVRHPEWYANAAVRKELFDTLRQLNVGAVITDTSGRRDVAHMELTIPKAFIRYVGNSLHATDYTRIGAWVQRIKYWLQNGLQELYFFMHMHDEAFSPELSVYLVDRLNEVCDLRLQKPAFVQGGLFDQFANVGRRS